MLVIDDWDMYCEMPSGKMPLDLTDDKSTLVQVMARCRQATSHHLKQCWLNLPRHMTSPGHNELRKPKISKVTFCLQEFTFMTMSTSRPLLAPGQETGQSPTGSTRINMRPYGIPRSAIRLLNGLPLCKQGHKCQMKVSNMCVCYCCCFFPGNLHMLIDSACFSPPVSQRTNWIQFKVTARVGASTTQLLILPILIHMNMLNTS